MTLQERLRFELSRIADEECYDGGSHQLIFLRQSEARELRDALDAQAARIKELEGALRVAIKHWEGWCDQNNGSMPDNVMGGEADDYARAREALK